MLVKFSALLLLILIDFSQGFHLPQDGNHNKSAIYVRRKRSNRCDNNKSPSDRIDCGYAGITRSQCEELNCCFDSGHSNAPNCYIGSGGTYTRYGFCDFSIPLSRRDCGYPGITKSQCESKHCCYDDRVNSARAKHCFFSGLGANADTSIAELHGETSWAEGSMTAGRVGAGAQLGWDSVGARVDASLGEIGGKIGKGPLSVGGKLGLSLDTAASIGANTELKVLGTGFSIGRKHGIEFCYFGSCISIG